MPFWIQVQAVASSVKKTLEKLKQALPGNLAKTFRKQTSQVKFRFGNNQTLTSQYAIQIPLKHVDNKKHWLSVEVVPGATPFLFSKRAFKMLHGSLDSKTDQCHMSKVQKTPIALATSPTGLYLINMLDICYFDEIAMYQETVSTETSCSFQSKSKWGNLGCKTSNIVKSKEVDGDNHFRQATVTHRPKFQRCRSFHSSEHTNSFQRSAVSADHDAANGQCVEINRRGSHSSAHFAPADLREPAGKTRGDFRDGDREQPGDAHATPGDDETDSAPKCFAGVPQGRDQQSEEDSRTQDSSHQLQCCSVGSVRGFYDGRGRTTYWNDPTKDQNAICGVTGGQLGRNRRSGGDCDPAESAECTIDHGIQSKLTGAASTHLAVTGTSVPGGVGIQHHQFWPQAQGEDLCHRDAARSRISELELGKVCQPDARAPGLRALWPVVDERGGQRSVSESDFSAEVKAIRESIARSGPKPCLQTQHEAIFQTFQNFEDSLQTATVFPTSKSRVFLLEIYANPNSPLTEAVQQMGHRALRFTKQDGDLSTFSGRHKLWSWIEMYQPEHVWLAPECGPWGGWNRLNKMKTKFKDNKTNSCHMPDSVNAFVSISFDMAVTFILSSLRDPVFCI